MALRITPDTTIGELSRAPELGAFGEALFTNLYGDPPHDQRPLKQYGYEKCAFEPTLRRLEEMTAAGLDAPYAVYSPEEIAACPDKGEVKLFHFPVQERRPYMLICPGGAYARQWGIVEGLAIAVECNRLGYPAMVLYYRTRIAPPFDEPLLPKPMEDLKRAVQWITDNHERLNVEKDGYAVAGFSAGAHLAAEWGTEEFGWRRAGLGRPKALVLGYVPAAIAGYYEAVRALHGDRNNPAAFFMYRMAGYDPTPEDFLRYDILAHMEADYPPAFLVACEDDPTVPIRNTRLMDEKLAALGVAHETLIGKTGGHSFGVGVGTDVEGWMEKAVAFWQKA